MYLRKKAVVLGVLFVIVGLVILIFPSREVSSDIVDISTWSFPTTLEPQDITPLRARLMHPGEWFQLDMSSTDLMELRVFVLSEQGTVETPVFVETGTRFNQKVTLSLTGTYKVEMKNVSPSTITLSGNVIAQKWGPTSQTLNPYAFLGFLLLVGGAIALYFGLFRKPKTRLKSERRF